METNYKSNSHKSKEDMEAREPLKPVVKGATRVEKQSVGRKFSDLFLVDSFNNVKQYLIFDVLVPAVKDTMVDLISNGANMLAYGSPNSRRSSNRSGSGRTNYTTYYRGDSRSDNRREERSSRNMRSERCAWDEVIFDERGDAEEVLDCLEEIMDKYQLVRLSEFYELSKRDGYYTDSNYGWTEFNDLRVVGDRRKGYRLTLPRPIPLD